MELLLTVLIESSLLNAFKESVAQYCRYVGLWHGAGTNCLPVIVHDKHNVLTC